MITYLAEKRDQGIAYYMALAADNTLSATQLDEKYKKNIFICDNNLCGIYVPEKYLKYFSFNINSNEMYSYEFEMHKVIKNLI